MAGFTPGPWVIECDPVVPMNDQFVPAGWSGVTGSNWHNFALVVTRMEGDEADSKVGLANARLIAAAPDLYEALTDLFEEVKFSDVYDANPALVDRVRAALAKATGAEQ